MQAGPQHGPGHAPGEAVMRRLRKLVIRLTCRWQGHRDYGCWSETPSLGECCNRCGRISWTWSQGKELDPPRLQAPTYPTLR